MACRVWHTVTYVIAARMQQFAVRYRRVKPLLVEMTGPGRRVTFCRMPYAHSEVNLGTMTDNRTHRNVKDQDATRRSWRTKMMSIFLTKLGQTSVPRAGVVRCFPPTTGVSYTI